MGASSRYNVYDSPFLELSTPFTAWEALKMALLLWTVPIRMLVAFASIVGVAVVNSLAVAGCDLDAPLPHWRRRLVELSSQTCCAIFLRCFSFWAPHVEGAEHLAAGRRLGALAVMNHVSYLDAFVCTWSFCFAGLTMDFSRELPVLGHGVRALQNIYLGGGGKDGKRRGTLVELMRERARDARMPPFVVAPEGTLSDGRCLLSFKTGAFAAGVPVVPVLLRYRLTPHNPSWGVITPAWHALRLACQWSNGLTVQLLPPYVPSEAELADPALYAANVRRLMAHALGGVKLVDQDRAHYLALTRAGVRVTLDGRRVVAPPGVLAADGTVDLEPFMVARNGGGGGGGAAAVNGNGAAKKVE